MFNRILLIVSSVIMLAACGNNSNVKKDNTDAKKDFIRVGVFNVNGGSPECITDACEAVRIDRDMKVEIVRASQIASEELNNFDVIIMPGGSGTSETLSLGQKGIQSLRDWVKQDGKCLLGICAGAYVMSNTPNYNCFALNGTKAIDIEHDHRGHGLAKFTLSDKGLRYFPELESFDTLYCQYYEGPVLVDADNDKISYETVAVMQSDVHLIEGTPANMTNNKPFVVMSEVGEGRTVAFVGHPETTPGMRWMVPRMIRIALDMPLIEYPKSVVRPEMWTKEILFDKARRAEQDKHYTAIKYGDEGEILAAIEWLIDNAAWSSQKWMPGLLRHSAPEIRIAAAHAIVELESTESIPDLKSAIAEEKDNTVKDSLKSCLKELESMLG
ncbi:MAG: BPL-N domain-containing protein [Bacteroidales bacterium]|jgi:glutamine amidotransferase-like uncharacterized protein|nr:BPL-N domain-containing protein [Bacteroidales bacterium]